MEHLVYAQPHSRHEETGWPSSVSGTRVLTGTDSVLSFSTHHGARLCLLCASPGMFVVRWAEVVRALAMSCCPFTGLNCGAVRVPRRHPPVLRMVLEALQAGEQRRGTSVVAIKVYILQKYPTVDAIRLKYLLKRALNTGMQRGLLARPTNSKAKGATGSFKVSMLGMTVQGAAGRD